uniref:Uncharacterized protein n=1 Tax=Setaria italica TaxID=4555 RepID=K3Y4E8_SETIT
MAAGGRMAANLGQTAEGGRTTAENREAGGRRRCARMARRRALEGRWPGADAGGQGGGEQLETNISSTAAPLRSSAVVLRGFGLRTHILD